MRYWQSDNRTSAAVLPPLRATQKGNLARPLRQQNICCSPAPSTSYSERKSGQTTQTTEHLLQSCPLYELLRKGIWPDHSDNRTSAAVLPPLRATLKGNLARPHSRNPKALGKPGGPMMYCHLHSGDWSFHLTNEQRKKKKISRSICFDNGTC